MYVDVKLRAAVGFQWSVSLEARSLSASRSRVLENRHRNHNRGKIWLTGCAVSELPTKLGENHRKPGFLTHLCLAGD